MRENHPYKKYVFIPDIRTRMTAYGHAAAAVALSLAQEHFLFPPDRRIPGKNGLREMLLPQDYRQLNGHAVIERQLTGDVPITIWEKKADEGKPHYLLFHGQAGHWADGGPAPKERYASSEIGRANGLEYLQAIAETGAGFTAVSLRGYGKTPGEPGEKAFKDDVAAVLDDLLKKEIPPERIVVGGESLGGASALEAAVQMTKRGFAPAQVDIINPFASIAEVAAESFDKISALKHVPRFGAEFLDEHILRHHFDNREKLGQLSKKTVIHIATSTKDSKIDHHHSEDLLKLAKETHKLDAVQTLFPNNNHRDWRPAHLLAQSIRIYNERHGLPNDQAMLERLETHDYSIAQHGAAAPNSAASWQTKTTRPVNAPSFAFNP